MNDKNKKIFLAKILTAIVIAVFTFQFGLLPVFATGGAASSIKDTMSREAISVSSAHVISMTLPVGGLVATDTLTITYPGTFGALTTTPDVICGGGATPTAGLAGEVLTITAGGTACTGTLTIGSVTPFTATNPGSAGSYTVTLGGTGSVTGSYAVPIVNNDQVGITATVNPSITFDVGSQASATACAGTFNSDGGTVALGTLSTASVTSSDDVNSTPHICSRLTTNAASGAVVTVASANAALASISKPTDTIASATATPLLPSVSGYGLCAGSAGSDSGKDATTPTGASPSAVAPFNNVNCDSTHHNIGGLTLSPQNVWTVSAASQNAFFRLYIKASVSGTVPSHSDYADTLTFVATGTF
jgi:hypothetical protein